MNWIFENNINTDLITPGRYNITTDPKELAKVAFIEYEPRFAKEVTANDFIVAGTNFGCGSSRETAATALRGCEVKAVIAKSFARIFYRNCANQGVLAIIADTSGIKKVDKLELDLKNKTVVNKTKNKTIPAIIPDFMITLHEYGGITSYIKKNGFDAFEKLFQQV